MATINSIGVGLSGISGASSFVGRDANANTTANSYIPGSTSIVVTGSGSTTLTVASAQIQIFTGTGVSHSIVLPVVSTLSIGQSYRVINQSNLDIPIKSSGLNDVFTVLSGFDATFTCISLTGTTASSWATSSATTSPAVLLTPTADQTITAHNLIMSATSGSFIAPVLQAGLSTGTSALPLLILNSQAGNLGSLAMYTTAMTGNFEGDITNASLTNDRTWTLPDASGTVTVLGNSTTGSGVLVLATSPTITTPNISQINVGGAPIVDFASGFNYVKLVGGAGHGGYLLYQGFDPAGNDVPLYFNAGSSGSISFGTQATADQFVFATGGAKLTTLNFINTGTAQTLTVPDATGTIALTSDVPVIWSVNSATSFTAAAGNGYILTHVGAVTVTLPTTFAAGTQIALSGGVSGGSWTISIPGGTSVAAYGTAYTTSVASTHYSDTIILLATAANTSWTLLNTSSTSLTFT